jgi:hypothetical protein
MEADLKLKELPQFWTDMKPPNHLFQLGLLVFMLTTNHCLASRDCIPPSCTLRSRRRKIVVWVINVFPWKNLGPITWRHDFWHHVYCVWVVWNRDNLSEWYDLDCCFSELALKIQLSILIWYISDVISLNEWYLLSPWYSCKIAYLVTGACVESKICSLCT